MFDWIKTLITSRYVKSATRYVLVALVAYLIKIPVLAPLAEFLQAHLGDLTSIFADLVLAIVALWSVAKNSANAKVEIYSKEKVK